MEHYAGIDVSLEWSSVCVVDAGGKIVREAKFLSEPAALIIRFHSLGLVCDGSGWTRGRPRNGVYAALYAAGFTSNCWTRGMYRNAFKAMAAESDRNDPRGIAQLMRLGWFRPMQCKSIAAQDIRALLTARKLEQSKPHDAENSLRGILRGRGLKVSKTTTRSFVDQLQFGLWSLALPLLFSAFPGQSFFAVVAGVVLVVVGAVVEVGGVVVVVLLVPVPPPAPVCAEVIVAGAPTRAMPRTNAITCFISPISRFEVSTLPT
jgi:hypothetical protein